MADEYDALKGAASGASTGAALGPWGAAIGAAAGAATPFISKALGGLFGVDDAEAAQKAAYAPIRRIAEGGTTQAQAGMAYSRAKALQDLQSMAAQGTAQQRAGLQHQAMMQSPEVQARYASQLADLRAMQQERANSQLAYYEGERARQEAARKRQALSSAVEGGLGMATKLGMSAFAPDQNKLTEQQANEYNQQNTKGRASASDLGAAWSARMAGLAKPTTPATTPATPRAHVPIAPADDMSGSTGQTPEAFSPITNLGSAVRSRTPIAPAEDMSGSLGATPVTPGATKGLGSATRPTTPFYLRDEQVPLDGTVSAWDYRHGRNRIRPLIQANEELDRLQGKGTGGFGVGGAGSF